MERTSIRSIERGEADETTGRRRLGDALGTSELAVNHYRLDPGETLPGGLHAHADQEETFVVLAGEAVFETLDGEVRVDAEEVIRFEPGEFQSGRNAGDDELVVIALGTPRDTEDVRVPLSCPDCGHDDLRLDFEGGVSFVCPDCGGERVPASCPDCGSDDHEVTLADPEDSDVVVVCRDCGTTFEEAPLVAGDGAGQ